MPPREGTFLRRDTFGAVWPIEKHCKAYDGGVGLKGAMCKKTGEPILTMYTPWALRHYAAER